MRGVGISLMTLVMLVCARHVPGQEREIDQLRDEAQALMQKAQALAEEGVSEKARRLKEKAMAMQREAGALAERLRDELSGRKAAERRESAQAFGGFLRGMREIRERIRQLSEQGRQEEAKALQQTLRMLLNSFGREHRKPGASERREELVEQFGRKARGILQRYGDADAEQAEREELVHAESREVEQRIHHLHSAAENLRAAGLYEEAEQLAAKAEEMELQLHRQSVPKDDMQRQLHELREHTEGLTEHAERLIEHVEDLAQQVEGLTEGLEDLAERVEDLTDMVERLQSFGEEDDGDEWGEEEEEEEEEFELDLEWTNDDSGELNDDGDREENDEHDHDHEHENDHEEDDDEDAL